jgi:transposase
MEHFIMSRKERTQLIVFEKLKNGEISQVEAANRLKMSTRWLREKLKRYKETGDHGLIHKNRGKESSKKWNTEQRALAIELLKSEWQGFGPTFACEKLLELKGIKISKETLRKVMIQEGIWNSKQRKLKHRARRTRRTMLGLLVQLDGSPHDWFEGRAPKCTLLVFIDDATSKILWLEFVRSENEMDVLRSTKNYIQRYGIPHEFYVDFGGVFSVNLNNDERDKKTQWERAASELLINIIHAHSPQAKGRVERANGTMQDRLVKELRLKDISSIEDANKYLRESDFMLKHNERFAVKPAQGGDAHRPAQNYDLEATFCRREARILANDYTIAFNKQYYQLEKQQRTIIRPKDKITVSTFLDGSISLSIRKTVLAFSPISNKPQKPVQDKIFLNQRSKPCENSRRWASGSAPRFNNESRVKLAAPATEAK